MVVCGSDTRLDGTGDIAEMSVQNRALHSGYDLRASFHPAAFPAPDPVGLSTAAEFLCCEHHTMKLFWLIISSLLVAAPLQAQETASSQSRFRFWGTGGLSIGGVEGEAVAGGRLSVSGGRTWLWQLGYRDQAVGFFDSTPSQKSIGLAAGRGSTGGRAIAAAFAGPVVAWGLTRTGRAYTVPGATVNAQLYMLPFGIIGAGVEMFVTLTSESTTLGASLSFVISNR